MGTVPYRSGWLSVFIMANGIAVLEWLIEAIRPESVTADDGQKGGAPVTFDVEDIRKLKRAITSKLDACDNGECIECATLGQSLAHYARACCDFTAGVREWAQKVFSGQLPYDSQVEREWLDGGTRLYHRALAMWQRGTQSESACYELPGHRSLEASLWQLHRILTQWVSPKLSVAPSPRHSLPPEVVAEAERRIADLPPLPDHWEPVDPAQRALHRKAKTS